MLVPFAFASYLTHSASYPDILTLATGVYATSTYLSCTAVTGLCGLHVRDMHLFLVLLFRFRCTHIPIWL